MSLPFRIVLDCTTAASAELTEAFLIELQRALETIPLLESVRLCEATTTSGDKDNYADWRFFRGPYKIRSAHIRFDPE